MLSTQAQCPRSPQDCKPISAVNFTDFSEQWLGLLVAIDEFPGFPIGAAGGDPGLQFFRPPEGGAPNADRARDFAGGVPGPPGAGGLVEHRRRFGGGENEGRGGKSGMRSFPRKKVVGTERKIFVVHVLLQISS